MQHHYQGVNTLFFSAGRKLLYFENKEHIKKCLHVYLTTLLGSVGTIIKSERETQRHLVSTCDKNASVAINHRMLWPGQTEAQLTDA